MSLSKHEKEPAARVAGKRTSNMKSSSNTKSSSSSPRAKHLVKSSNHHNQTSPDLKQQRPQPDSGFFDGSDTELYGDDAGNTFQYNFSNDKDWELFAGEPLLNLDDDYYFNDDDAVDIASTKANHGSLYNGNNNQGNTRNATRSDRSASEVIQENPQGADPPHRYTYHPTTQVGTTQLQTWEHTFEQHESIAYRFEQPPFPTHVFHDLQSWHEDIDLDLYAVLF